MELTIVRHGETEWNVARRLQGVKDSKLTAAGELQVKALAKALQTREFDQIISSDLGRAVKTAEEINRYFSLEVQQEKAFRERGFGIMEGREFDVVKKEHPEVWTNYIARIADYRIPEGESLEEFNARVIGRIDELARIYPDQKILLVAHGGVLDCAIRRVFGLALSDRRCFLLKNTSVNRFILHDEFWDLQEWGNTDHIDGNARGEFS